MTYLCFRYILLNKIGRSRLIMCAPGSDSNPGLLPFRYPGHDVAVIHSLSNVGCNLGCLDLLDSICWSAGSHIEQPCRDPVFPSLKYFKFTPHLSHPTMTGQPRLLLLFLRMEGIPFWDYGWLKSPCPIASPRWLWRGWGWTCRSSFETFLRSDVFHFLL